MKRVSTFISKFGGDVLITIGAIAGAIDGVLRQGLPGASAVAPWFLAAAIALIVLPHFWRKRFPFTAAAAVWILAATMSFVDGRSIPASFSVVIAGLAAAFMLGRLQDAFQAGTGLAIVLGGTLVIVNNIPNHVIASFITIPAQFSLAWLAGFAVRERAAQARAAEERAMLAERDRETGARIAVAEERARIARELHDVVAHAVSVMVLQAGAVRHRLHETLPEDSEALLAVERTGRTALTEMRRLLGAMRDESDDAELAPQPGLENLDSLIADVCRAGLPVELHYQGERFSLPRAIDLSAYRVVQEGLTNALKHAHASKADVTIRYEPQEVCVEVCDDGLGSAADQGVGYGLLGMHERVKIYGGEMTAQPDARGGFVLKACLPITGEET